MSDNCRSRFPVSEISLSRINSDDRRFRITSESSPARLIPSVRTAGLMQPPLLLKNPADESFTVVCGFRRIAACRELGWPNIVARILDPGTPESECVKFAITDNSFQRPLNLIEMSRAFCLLSRVFSDAQEMGKEAAALGLPENPAMIRKIQGLCLLPDPIQAGILSDTIPLPVALELGRLDPDTACTFAELFELLKPSLNKQREIITLMEEIAAREDRSVSDIFEEKHFREILSNKEKVVERSRNKVVERSRNTDRNQKLREIRIYLRQRRFPAISRAEQTFEQLMKELGLGNTAKLIPPANFEGTVYTLNLSFRNPEELKAHQIMLDSLIRNPSLKKILG